MAKTVIDRKKSSEVLSAKIQSINANAKETALATKLKQQLRGNEYTVAKRLLHDVINAFNQKRTQAPKMEEIDGTHYLRTSPALIASAEKGAFTPRTAKNCVNRLLQRDLNGRGFKFLLSCRLDGNDLLLQLNEAFFCFAEISAEEVRPADPRPHPHKPPDLQGKADMDQEEYARKAGKLAKKYAK